MITRVLRLVTGAYWLYDGSLIVWRRRTDALTGWVRAGRREDLPGWRGALGPIVRLLILGVVAYMLWAIIRALPWLLWALTGWWLAAAWKAARGIARTAPEEGEEELPEESAATPDADTVRALLLEVMGDAPAVHLRTVLAHLQEQGHGEGWTVADLRARLEALDISTDPKVKAPGSKSPTRGVRRVDLTPSPAAAQETSTAASTAA